MCTEQVWDSFHEKLFGFIRSKVKDEQTAKDILQSVFEKIHTHLHTLKDQQKLESWVYQITRNEITNNFRKERIYEDVDSETAMEIGEADFNDHFASCVNPFMESLDPKYQTALKMTDLGHLTQKEFAENQGMTHSGARARVQRARKQLKDEFEKCCLIISDKYGNIIDYSKKSPCRSC